MDALLVIKELEKRGIDLLEISGGTYEDVTFFTQKGVKQSTKEREAYFLDFAQEVRKSCQVPIICLLYTSPSPRDATLSRMPSSA